jgi:hypothetical protein
MNQENTDMKARDLVVIGGGACPWRIPKSRGNWGLKKSVAV